MIIQHYLLFMQNLKWNSTEKNYNCNVSYVTTINQFYMYDKSNIRKKVKKGMVWLAKCYHMKDVLFVYLHNI